jgi:hypothetical protein
MPYNTPEKRKEYYRQYNILNSEKRKKQRLAKRDERIKYCKEWRKNNQERVIKYNKKIYADNKEEILKNLKSRRDKNISKYLDREKEYREKNKIVLTYKKRDYYLFNKYKITVQDYENMFKAQEGKCAICEKHQNEFNYLLHVDHDHKTGKIRDLLCSICNTRLGYYEKSDIDKLNKYLDKHKEKLN